MNAITISQQGVGSIEGYKSFGACIFCFRSSFLLGVQTPSQEFPKLGVWILYSIGCSCFVYASPTQRQEANQLGMGACLVLPIDHLSSCAHFSTAAAITAVITKPQQQQQQQQSNNSSTTTKYTSNKNNNNNNSNYKRPTAELPLPPKLPTTTAAAATTTTTAALNYYFH